jgi:hypothetical protein
VKTNALVGVPYTEEHDRERPGRFRGAGRPERRFGGLQERYGSAAYEAGKDVNVRNFDGQPALTEMPMR